jgi:hypothetical protein
MTPSPIALTPEQRQEIYNQKAERFMDGMRKLTEETGMTIVPDLHHTDDGLAVIILKVVDKPVPPPAVDNSQVI